MSGDTLSSLLRAVRLHGAVFYRVQAISPWVTEAPPARQVIPVVMPGAEHLIEFHGVVEGSCWGGIAGEDAVRLESGDVILFPQGDPHVMSSAPRMRAPSTAMDRYLSPRPPQLPYVLCMSAGESGTAAPASRPGEGATLVCGFLGFDARPFNPLLASLPRVLHVPGSALGADSWVPTLMRTAVAESHAKRPGGEAILERMSEMLFVEVLRRHIDSLPAGHTGWLAGMRDPAVGRALSLIHEKPSEAWTLERLGEQAGLSRSSLHERFVYFIDQPPMQYVAQWRMQVAAGLLRDTNAKLSKVATDVGYESEEAFSRAFKRIAGVSPGAWRKVKREIS
jgi:AraC-like DNA-binding protein